MRKPPPAASVAPLCLPRVPASRERPSGPSPAQTASSTHPRMHSAWGALLALLPRLHAQPADAPSKGASGAPTAATSAAAVALWEEVCERSLFGSSHERKCVFFTAPHPSAHPASYGRLPALETTLGPLTAPPRTPSNRYLGFELFNRLVPRCSVDALPALFSNTFMRCLVNNLSKEDNLLHSTARHCLQKARARRLGRPHPQSHTLCVPLPHAQPPGLNPPRLPLHPAFHQLLSYVQSPEGEPIRAPVTAALQRFGGGRFDRLTQTDAVQKLTADLSGASVKV